MKDATTIELIVQIIGMIGAFLIGRIKKKNP